MFHSHWFTAGPANELLSRTPRVPNPDCRTGQVPPGSWWRRDLQGPEKSVTSVGVRRSFYIASDSHPKAMNSDPRERVSRSRTCHIQVLQQLKIEFGVAIVPFVRSMGSSSMIPFFWWFRYALQTGSSQSCRTAASPESGATKHLLLCDLCLYLSGPPVS